MQKHHQITVSPGFHQLPANLCADASFRNSTQQSRVEHASQQNKGFFTNGSDPFNVHPNQVHPNQVHRNQVHPNQWAGREQRTGNTLTRHLCFHKVVY